MVGVVSNRHINNLMMDYLVTEGYPETAQILAAEANIPTTADFDSISGRVEIRNLIYAGDIQTAIEKINEMNPQVCLSLKPPHLLAMIRSVSCTTHTPPGVDEKTNYLQSSV